MPLILAIEPDKKQAAVVKSIARGSKNLNIVVADSTERALRELGERVPDLILTAQLLPPKDESALDAHLRTLDAAGTRVPTLVIPVLSTTSRRTKAGGLLTKLRKTKTAGTDGCDPAAFADQISEYLERAAADREMEAEDRKPLAESIGNQPFRGSADPDLSDWAETEEEVAPQPHYRRPPPFEAEAFRSAAPAEAEPLVQQPGSIFGRIVEPAFERPAPVEPIVLPQYTIADAQDVEADLPPSRQPDRHAEEQETELDVSPAGADSWEEITIEEEPASSGLEITAVPIDLSAFVRELEETVESHERRGSGSLVVDDGVSVPLSEPVIPVVDLDPIRSGVDTFDVVRAADPAETYAASAYQPPGAGLASLEVERPVLAWPMRTRYSWPRIEGVLIEDDTFSPADAAPGWETMETGESFASVGTAILVEPETSPVNARAIAASSRIGIEPDPVVTANAATPEWMDLLTAIRRDIQELRAERQAAQRPGDQIAEESEAAKGKRAPASAPKAPRKKKRQPQPSQDEWGIFDPDQCGFAALLDKLDELEGDT
jgi:CheY-like chemotaxis protein